MNTPLSPDAPPEVLAEVQKEYEATLALPAEKPVPQWMLMPVGLVKTGKTTVVKLLSEQLGLVRISTDEVRKRLKERGYSYAGARDVAHELSKKYLKLGYSIAIDGNTGSARGLEYNKKTAEAFPQVRQLFIHINPPDASVLTSLQNYRPDWLFRDAEHAVESFLKNKSEFVLPDLPFVYTFDPSGADLPQQIEEGIRAIKASLAAY